MHEHSTTIFEQYGHIKCYCTVEKIAEWKKEKASTENRWVEVFQHFERNNEPYTQFSPIVEYVLCFPGSSAPAERLFAHGKKIRTEEITTSSALRSILFVKFNMESHSSLSEYSSSSFASKLKFNKNTRSSSQSQLKLVQVPCQSLKNQKLRIFSIVSIFHI